LYLFIYIQINHESLYVDLFESYNGIHTLIDLFVMLQNSNTPYVEHAFSHGWLAYSLFLAYIAITCEQSIIGKAFYLSS
jgi:hypothetical protein